MKMKVIIFLSILIILMSFPNEKRQLQASQVTTVKATNANIKIIGRKLIDSTTDTLTFDWSAVTVAFAVSGTCNKISLRLNSKSTRFNVSLNGVLANLLKIDSMGMQDQLIATGLKTTTEIKLIKLTEAAWGYTIFESVKLEGENCVLTNPPKLSDRFIEFVGDSDTCAYGVDARRFSEFSLDGQNILNGHGGLISKALDADFSAK